MNPLVNPTDASTIITPLALGKKWTIAFAPIYNPDIAVKFQVNNHTRTIHLLLHAET